MVTRLSPPFDRTPPPTCGRFQHIVDHDLPGHTHQWHAVQIRVRGEEIKVMLNEELIAASKHDKILNGRVGVSTINVGCVNWWRNPEVRDPDGKLLWKGWPDLKQGQ